MDKTFTFTLQIDAPRDVDPEALALAVYRAIEYAKENDIGGAEALNNEVGQVTII